MQHILKWSDNNKIRALFFQTLALSAIIFLLVFSFTNLQDKLATKRITTGFDFLEQPANFDLSPHFIEFNRSSSYGDAFIVAVINTLLIASVSIVIATLLGIFLGMMRLSKNWLLAKASYSYVETLRNIPLLLQIFFWYFAVLRTLPHYGQSIMIWDIFQLNNRGIFFPEPIITSSVIVGLCVISVIFILWILNLLAINKYMKSKQRQTRLGVTIIWLGLLYYCVRLLTPEIEWIIPILGRFNFNGGWSLMPEFLAIVIALSLYTASYIAEIIRGGIESVNRGQTEAAYALGISSSNMIKKIILPQALRAIIPAMTSQYLSLIKNTSLAAAIAFPEIVAVFAGTVLTQTGQSVETLVMAMGVYLSISLVVSLLMNWYNYKIKPVN